MKNKIKKLIVWKLNILAQLYLRRFKPDIIAITGNVGKTSTKEAVAAVLRKTKKVRAGRGNLNNEFGVPLTIIGDWGDEYYDKGSGMFFWLKVLAVGFLSLIIRREYPEVLILEYGADKPGDIAKLVKKYSPRIGIVTAVGEIPVHVEYFSDTQGIAKEKSKLVSGLDNTGYAILNHDDPLVYDMKEKTKAKVMSYGFTEGTTIGLSNLNMHLSPGGKPDGVGFKIHHGPHTFVPTILHGVLGKSQALAAGAAACVGIIYGMNLIEISEGLGDYESPNGRLKVLGGIKNTTIIDDTYNAAPASMHLALDLFKEFPIQQVQGNPARKIAVLGDMLELGKYTLEAHEKVGNIAAGIADILVTVGLRGKFIAYAAENQMSKENIFSFPTSDMAKVKVQELLAEGDLILVKGSQGVRMEKIVEEIMAEPERKNELLVRQGMKWLKK